MKKEVLVHGAMKYRCDKCGRSWWMFLEKGIEEFGKNHKPSPFVSCAVVVERLWMFLELSKSPMVAINPFPLVKDISPIKRILIVGFRFFPSFFSRGWNSGLQYIWNDVEGPETLAIP